MDTQSTQQAQHPLTLKVMRLSRPTFIASQPIYNEPPPVISEDQLRLGKEGVEQMLANDLLISGSRIQSTDPKHQSAIKSLSSAVNIRDFMLTDALALPGSFGNIYLGETFTCYLCVNNESNHGVRNITFKAELQTNTFRIPLLANSGGTTDSPIILDDDSNALTPSILPRQTLEYVVSHEMKELGVHVLICTISYSSRDDNQRKYFRKFYKFQALNPLAVKTKVSSFSDGRVFLEAQVHNTTQNALCLEKMNLDPAEGLSCQDLNGGPLGAECTDETSKSARTWHLGPQDMHQFLFLIQPSRIDDYASRFSSVLGKLDIVWRGRLGEPGRLQTSQLVRKPPPVESIECTVLTCPQVVIVEKPFKVECRVRNIDTKIQTLQLTAIKAKMGAMLIIGLATIDLEDLQPGEQRDFQLDLFPLLTGIHRMDGIRIVDTRTGQGRDLNDVLDVCVTNDYNSTTSPAQTTGGTMSSTIDLL